MTAVFPTIIAVLIGLSFEEFYGEIAMPEADLRWLTLALPFCLLPVVGAEILLYLARTRFDRGRPFDFRRYAGIFARLPLPLYVAVLYLFRWPAVVEPLGVQGTVLLDHLVVLFPYVVLFFACLVESLRVRRAMHLTDEGAMPATLNEVIGPVMDAARQLGLVLAPVLGLMFALDLVRDTPLRLYFQHLPLLSTLFLVAIFFLLAIFYPILFRLGLNLKPLIRGAPLREHLERQALRLGFECRDVLMWTTRRPTLNAAIVGFIPRFRYVILTNQLCLRLTRDEVGAVFTHEVGHGKRHHAVFYLLSSLTFLTLLVPFGALVGREVEVATHGRIGAPLAGAVLLYLPAFAIYWKLLFGHLSKRFELEADVYGVEASQDPRLFISTLEKVARLARIRRSARAIRHFSIAGRTDFLRRVFLEGDHERLRRFRMKIQRVRRAVVIAAAVVVTLGAGWLALESMRGAGVIYLELGRPDKARVPLEGFALLRPDDAVVLALLSEADLYVDSMPQVDRGDHWVYLTTLASGFLNYERTAVLDTLWVGWARTTAAGRHDLAAILLKRMDVLNVVDRDGAEEPFDRNLGAARAAMEQITEALVREDVLFLRRQAADWPHWLRRLDARRARAYLETWVEKHKNI